MLLPSSTLLARASLLPGMARTVPVESPVLFVGPLPGVHISFSGA